MEKVLCSLNRIYALYILPKVFGFLVILQFTITQSFPVNEFQYPCHTDICNYPDQYCSSGADMCLDCKFECTNLGKENFPLGCKTFCTLGTEIEATGEKSWREHEAWFYSTVTLLIFGGVLLVVLVAYLRDKGYIRYEKAPNQRTDESEHLVKDKKSSDEYPETESGASSSFSSKESVPTDADFGEETKKSYCQAKLLNVPPSQKQKSGETELVTSHSLPHREDENTTRM